MSDEDTTAVAEPEASTTTIPSLGDDYAGDPPGDDDALPATAEPSGADTGEEKNAAEEVTKPAEEEAAEAEEPEFPEELVEQAKSIGYADPDKFGSRENLQHAVDQFNQQMSSLGRNAMQAPTQTVSAPVAPVSSVVPAALVAPVALVAPATPEVVKFGEEFEPELRDPLNRMAEQHRTVQAQQDSRMEALQATVSRLEQQGLQQARMEISNRVDSFIAGLPEGYAEHLGKGSRSQLGSNSEASKARSKIDEEIEVLISGYGAANRELPSEGDLLMAATRNVLGSKNDSIIQKQTIAQVQKRQKQATARPAGQKSSRKEDLSKKSQETIDEICRRVGIPDGDDGETF